MESGDGGQVELSLGGGDSEPAARHPYQIAGEQVEEADQVHGAARHDVNKPLVCRQQFGQ